MSMEGLPCSFASYMTSGDSAAAGTRTGFLWSLRVLLACYGAEDRIGVVGREECASSGRNA